MLGNAVLNAIDGTVHTQSHKSYTLSAKYPHVMKTTYF